MSKISGIFILGRDMFYEIIDIMKGANFCLIVIRITFLSYNNRLK